MIYKKEKNFEIN